MKILLSLLFILTTFLCHAQNKNVEKEKWHWDNSLKQDTGAGYTSNKD
jgi:hypothetical protein